MGRNIVTGIDAGSSTIKVVVAEKKKGFSQPTVLSASQKTSSGMRKGYVVDIDSAIRSIRTAVASAEKSSGIDIKKAYVAIGGISLNSLRSKGSSMVSRADKEVSEYDVRQAVSQSESSLPSIANRKILHTIPISYKIDGAFVLGHPVRMKGIKLDIETLFITSLIQHIEDMEKAVDSAGVNIEEMIAAPYAASFAALSKEQKEAGCALVNIGSSTVSIIVFEEGLPISLEVFPIGSTHITNDIALGFQVPLDEAERMKMQFGSDSSSKKKLSDIIEARLGDIFDLVESHLKKINRNGLLPAGIILAGGGSSLFSLEEIAKASLKLPVTICTPNLEKVFVKNPGLTRDYVLRDPSWSVALGLCSMAFNEDETEMEMPKSGQNIISSATRFFKGLIP